MYKLDENKNLNLKGRNLTSLDELPYDIKVLDCSKNRLKNLPELPVSLRFLYCYDNNLVNLCDNNNLVILNCSGNNIRYLPKLSEKLTILCCDNNPLECLIPIKYHIHQAPNWYNKYYIPYINSYRGQKNILTKFPNQIGELLKQTKLTKKIMKDFAHLINSYNLNLL